MAINPPTTDTHNSATKESPSPPTTSIDYSHFRSAQAESMGSLYDTDIPLSHNIINLAKEAVALPYADVQLPIFAAYAMIPSAMASVVPLLFLQGEKGTGKSTLSLLASAIHNSQVFSAGTTFAALRNQFNRMRWADPEQFELELNTCLIFDNVNRQTLLNESLYGMFLNGYNRKTDSIQISKGDGNNYEFRVFGLKILNSIHPFFSQSKFSELNRRCIVLKFKQFESMTLHEKETCGFMEITERLELESIDLTPLHRRFIEFWESESNLLQYVSLKRQLMARRKKFDIPESITGARWTISIDLIVAGIVSKVWESLPAAIDALGKYWDWYDLNVANEYGSTHKVLLEFIAEETASAKRINEQFRYEIEPLEIQPDKLKKHINWASAQGMLDIIPNPATIAEVMADLGWRLDSGKKSKIAWVPNN